MIFQSLGSNYTGNDVLQAAFGLGSESDAKMLTNLLIERYGGDVQLFYKCREALAAGLDLVPYSEPKVAIIGFTCYAVYQAVEAVGGEAIYIDQAKDSLNFTVAELQKVYKKHTDLSAVIVQNTLGVPAPIRKIREFCDKNDLILIEDLAHSIGAEYASGEEVGTVGDMTCLSFSRDKVVDAVSGGALVVRNKDLAKGMTSDRPKKLSKSIGWRDRIYPFLAMLVRANYFIGLGKVFHKIFIRLGYMQKATDVSGAIPPQAMPYWNARAALNGFSDLALRLNRRRKIARIYADNLPTDMLVSDAVSAIERGTNLRFPVVAEDRDSLIQNLRKFGVHVSDTWYDSPVAPPRHLEKTNYAVGACPNAEDMTKRIVNLPTHHGVSEAMAKLIAERIRSWHSQ